MMKATTSAKKSAMNTRIRYAAYSLGISIGLTLLLAYPEVNRSRAKASAVMPTADLRAGTTDTVEETVTLSAASVKTWQHYFEWYVHDSYCGRPILFPVDQDYIPGSIVAGFAHHYDKGAIVFGCPDGSNTVYRGTVWFDLSDIVKKAPPLHISVKSATLHFKPSGECPGEVLYGTADWMKGYPDNTLVPGDELATLGSCIPGAEGCSIDVSVETVVNNWLKGEEHGGYANYGFVFKGMIEKDLGYENNDSCVRRYGDFSLTVTYRYDKEPVILVVLPTPTPKKEDTPVAKPGVSSPLGESTALARTNFALASNGGVATASSIFPDSAPSGANDGDRKGLNVGKNGFWTSATASFPAWLEVAFSGSKTISEIDLFTIQDDYKSPAEPDAKMEFTRYGLTDFAVQYWNESASAWLLIPGARRLGNNLVWNQFNFPTSPITTSKIRVLCLGSPDSYSRIAELEAWGK